MSRDTIFYTGGFNFPDRDAGSKRVLGNGQALRDGGFTVVFAGTEESARPEDRQEDGTFAYRGFRYLPDTGRAAPRWLRRARRVVVTHLGGVTAMRRLRTISPECLRAVIVYNGSSLLLAQLLAFGRRHEVPIIADTSEWYDPCQIDWGRLSPLWLDSSIRMGVMLRKVGNVIAISSLLQDHYARASCHVLRVPPLVDLEDADQYRQAVPASVGTAAPLQLAYAGVPGKKDLIGNAIRALDLLGEAARDVRLTLIGPTADEIRRLLGADGTQLDTHAERILCCGRKTHAEALALTAGADFTVLLRPDARFSRAGFSTKFVESLSLGVPVIANLTGDIGVYLTEGQEGIVLAAATPTACRDGIQRLLAMPRGLWRGMRAQARAAAERSFAYARFTDPLRAFVEEARIG